MEKRRTLSASERARVVHRQEGRCACKCGEKLQPGKIHFDHTTPLWAGGSNDLSNFCALVIRHHVKKTSKEAAQRAKADRAGAKHRGEHLNARDRELARILGKTKIIERKRWSAQTGE